MASRGQVDDAAQQSTSSSSEYLGTSPSSQTQRPPNRRQSSVRFSADTKPHSESPMSSYRRTPGDSDEITPIRTSDGQSDRRYNGTDESDPQSTVTSSTPVSSTIVDPTPESDSHAENEGDKKQDKVSEWFKRMSEKYGSVTLENKGSVARDHLALERTFLAWLRTSLAFASIGIAVTQLFRLNTTIQSRNDAMLMQRTVPLSPLIGQSVPAEMLPFLQQVAASMSAPASPPVLGPTLLDQLLLLPPTGLSPRDLQGLEASGSGTDAEADALPTGSRTRLRHVGKPLGATFIGISIVILFIGFHRYFESQHWIIRGKFPASRGSIFAVAFITGSLIFASLVVVLTIASTTYEKKR